MRLIDADALYIPPEEMNAKMAVACASTIDAVPVVRCRDCRWGRETCGNIECFVDLNAPTEYHGYNWFCPNGEGKDDV